MTGDRHDDSGAESAPAPPLDPGTGAVWRSLVPEGADGSGMNFGPDTLEVLRSVARGNRDAVLASGSHEEREVTVPGRSGPLTMSVFTPADPPSPAQPCIYWVHGGGLISGDRYLAAEALDAAVTVGAVVTSIEYRLAPEHPAPAALADCVDGLEWVIANAPLLGIDPARVVIGGQSAGGGLAAALALHLRDRSTTSVAGVMLNCPMLDDRMATTSANQFGDDLPWTLASNRFAWRSYLGALADDEVSPYEAPARATDLSGLPPVYVDAGSAEIFRDEIVDFASRIWADGGDCDLHVWAGGVHGFEVLGPDLPLSVAARRTRASWLARTLEKAGTNR